MRYLVTGATGFVGGHLVDRLLERGETVRALVRGAEHAEPLGRRGVEVFRGDLTHDIDLVDAVADVDVVVHSAAVVQVAARRETVWATNVEGTERLLGACARVGGQRFVFLSSVAVYGPGPVPMTEDTPRRPTAAYGQSKWAAEQALARYHAEGRLRGVALRPCAIYGPRDTHAWAAFVKMLAMRVVPLPGGGRRLLDLVYVSDVVDAALAAVECDACFGHAYNLTDGARHSYRDLFHAWKQATGRRPRILPVPGRAMVRVLQAGMRRKQRSRPTEDWSGQVERLHALNLDIHYSIDAARRDLGYDPRVDLVEGLRRSWQWQQRQPPRPEPESR